MRFSRQLLRLGAVWIGILSLLVAGTITMSSAASASSSGTYTFGVIDSTTGTYGVVGTDELSGISLAVNMINASGGVKGHSLAYKLVDDQGSVSLSTLALKRLNLQNKLPVILGPGISPEAAADAPLAQKYGALEMNFVAQSSTWLTTKNKVLSNVFAMATPQQDLADAMLKYMANVEKVHTASIAFANIYFGQLGEGFLAADAAKYGITITGTPSGWDPTTGEYGSLGTTIDSANPPGLFLWGAGSSSDAQVLASIRAAGYTGPIIGDVTFTEGDIPADAATAAPTVIGMSQINYAKPAGMTAKFISAYKQANNGALPDYLAAMTFDAVQILAQAIKKSGSYTAKSLAKALVGLKYTGANGQYAFSSKYHGGPGSGAYVPVTFSSSGAYELAPTS
jgi:branched-chain amino acid transport system substrate-binding protein